MRLLIVISIFIILSFYILPASTAAGYETVRDDVIIIAITSTGTSLESQISQNFGRCPYFIFFNCSDGTLTVVENPGVELQSGAGRNAAELVIGSGATHLVTGNIGDKVVDRLRSAGVEIITDLKRSMTVEEAIEMIRSGL